MTIDRKINGNIMRLYVNGRLDTTTSPLLENEINQNIKNIALLIIDMTNLQYISSAGLRVLLYTHKMMDKKGKLTITNANEDIMEVFDITGFSDILNIE